MTQTRHRIAKILLGILAVGFALRVPAMLRASSQTMMGVEYVHLKETAGYDILDEEPRELEIQLRARATQSAQSFAYLQVLGFFTSVALILGLLVSHAFDFPAAWTWRRRVVLGLLFSLVGGMSIFAAYSQIGIYREDAPYGATGISALVGIIALVLGGIIAAVKSGTRPPSKTTDASAAP